MQRGVIQLLLLFFFALVVSSVTFAACVEPSKGMQITSSQEFCTGFHSLEEPLTISGKDIIISCNNAILNGNGLNTGIQVLNSQSLTLRNCSFDNFHDAIIIDDNSSVNFDNVQITNGPNGISYENGSKITGQPQFENIVTRINIIEKKKQPEGSIAVPEQIVNTIVREQKIILFEPSRSEYLKYVNLLALDTNKIREATVLIKIVEKYAVIKQNSTDITISLKAEHDLPEFYVFEITKDYSATGEKVKDKPFVRGFEVSPKKQGETFDITYSISGAQIDIAGNGPITVFSTESTWMNTNKKTLTFSIWLIGFFGILLFIIIWILKNNRKY